MRCKALQRGVQRLQDRMAGSANKHNLKRDYVLEKVYTPKEILIKTL